jgi:glycine betaine/proline transport system ATP-binding protein
MNDNGISSIFAVDRDQKFLGVVDADDAAKAVETGTSARDIVCKVHPVGLDTHLADLFEDISKSSLPLAVVDEQGKLRGLVRRGAIINALAGNRPLINDEKVKNS